MRRQYQAGHAGRRRQLCKSSSVVTYSSSTRMIFNMVVPGEIYATVVGCVSEIDHFRGTHVMKRAARSKIRHMRNLTRRLPGVQAFLFRTNCRFEIGSGSSQELLRVQFQICSSAQKGKKAWCPGKVSKDWSVMSCGSLCLFAA